METKHVDYYIVEAIMERYDRLIRRIVTLFVVAIIASQAIWTYAWLQYDYSAEEISVDGKDGVANFIGNDGDILNGKDSCEAQAADKEKRENKGDAKKED